ncbi:MAG: group II intron reverse transcriptase/maturase [Deltaproteobacteria bacterium]|nr:group II intron reverse transcriptase/maturase [Deltaproteobacteria bacterium]
MLKAKPFEIPKELVWKAFKLVKANGGAAGVDGQSLVDFESQLGNNLYKIWNRMSSGSYFPPLVKAVGIPKKSGGERILGIPTVSDRVAQMVAKLMLEPKIEPYFYNDSYGYRPGKSAHQAIAVTRKRCWWHDWVLEFDIRGLFDNIDHGLLMKAVRHHVDCKWVLLYIERWLTAPMQGQNGCLMERRKGTPQGGVVSPLLANLFLHYAFDRWMATQFPKIPFCRYADDGLVHCRSMRQAQYIKSRLAKRMKECGLELHPEKTKIIYCKDVQRPQQYETIQFDFLGYTFRPRRSKDRYGRVFVNFTPGISRAASKAIRQTVRGWRLQLKSEKSIEDLGNMFRSRIRGWLNYYCKFYPSGFNSVARHLNWVLVRWAMRKFKRLRGHKTRSRLWLSGIAKRQPWLFPHWQAGFLP